MGTISTSMATSFKAELMYAGHCFGATATPTGNTHTTTTVDTISTLAGVVVGMTVTESHGDIPANTVVAAISSASAIVISQAATATHSGGTLTFTGDVYKIALIKTTPTGSYSSTTTNYTDVTGNSDETSGTGYSAGGLVLTNVSPVTSSTTAYITFGVNPSWTSSTFTTAGCIIYNSSVREGGTSGTNTTGGGRAVGVWDFGGNQSVTAGVFSIILPAASSSTAIVRLS